MKEKTIKIELKKLIDKNLTTRKAIQLVQNELKKRDDLLVKLDFKGIKFASRSFIDELYDLKRKLSRNKIRFAFINVNKNVKDMFNIVQNQRAEPKRKKSLQANLKVEKLESLACRF